MGTTAGFEFFRVPPPFASHRAISMILHKTDESQLQLVNS